MISERVLLLGTLDSLTGAVTPEPVVATLDPSGQRALSWTSLDAHEPHSTTPRRALLRLPDLALVPLDAPQSLRRL